MRVKIVLVSVMAFGACDGTDPIPVPSALVKEAAAATSVVGATIPLAVRVVDASGGGIAGAAVSWSTAHGSLSAASSTSDANGRAEVSWTLAGTLGTQSATATYGSLAPVSFDVSAAVGSAVAVTVSPSALPIVVNEQTGLSATAQDAFGNPISGAMTWMSSDQGIVTVSATGILTGKSEGSAQVTATMDGKSGSSAITVSPAVAHHIDVTAAVMLSPTRSLVDVADSAQLTATVYDVRGFALSRPIAWSSDTSIATVSSAGMVRGVSKGTTIITATSEGVSGSLTLTVVHMVLHPAQLNLAVGDSAAVALREAPALTQACRPIQPTWTSSNTAVVTIQHYAGQLDMAWVKAVGTGAATITGTCSLSSDGTYGTGKGSVTVAP